MDAIKNSTRQHHSRIPAPTLQDPARTVWCQGTVQRRVYAPDRWFVESCDNCQYLHVGFAEAAAQ